MPQPALSMMMVFDEINIAILLMVGLVTGFINTVAGGGSSITLPVLMFLGLPPTVANGTNRIAILMQSLAGVGTFKKGGILTWEEGRRFLIPSGAGAVLGAFSAITINERLLHFSILGVMIGMFFLILLKPEAWTRKERAISSINSGFLQHLIYFFIGFYGGFIQIGVGFLLLAGLVLGSGFDLIKANGIKVLIVLFYTVIALLIFWSSNNVYWRAGILLGIASMAGAYAGARFTIKSGLRWVRLFLLAALLVIIFKLTYMIV